MKAFTTLLAILAIAASTHAADFSSTGSSTETTIINTGTDQCAMPLHYNHDYSFENGLCWQYGGIVAPTYGAFAEGFNLGMGTIECLAIWVTQLGNYAGRTCDLYVWRGGVTSAPGNVLWVVTGWAFTSIPYWPSIGQNNFEVGSGVTGEFAAGYWADFSSEVCQWYIACDEDGFGGSPWTNIAPGGGYPSGWQNPAVVWGACQSLGIGIYFDDSIFSPVETATWGRIKGLF
jgi:hypothetical protein